MKFRSLLTAICVLAAAQIASAAGPYAYIANSGTKNVSVIDTASNTVTATVALPDDNGATLPNPYAYSITVGASGQYVYVGLHDTNEVVVMDVSTSTPAVVKRIALRTDQPGGLAVNAAETRLYVASRMSNTLIVIDITGSGAREVSRVEVEPTPISNPEGVVLNPAGTKAYVANTSRSNIAEISIDEVNNIYTRTSLIDTGVSSWPAGLAISTDGSKLYFASQTGNAGVVNTSTKAVTPMNTDTGNLSIALNPVSGNVYAPASATDSLFVFNGAGALLNSYSGASTSPWGSSVTPNGSSLFLAMYEDNKVKVYDTANLAAPPVAIDLTPTAGAGAHPTSFGKFIGPELLYTIAASATAPCTISPSGSVSVNQGGSRTFTINPDCRAKIPANGGFVAPDLGTTDSYTITNVTDNSKTISAAQYLFTLTANVTTSVGGYLINSAPLPQGVLDTRTSPTAKFVIDSTVKIKAGNGFLAQNWTGACVGTVGGECTLTADSDKTFGAEVVAQLGGPIYNVTKGEYYADWTACTASAANYDVIKLSTDSVNNPTTTSGPGYQYKLSNQWLSTDYNTQDPIYHPMTLTITNIAVTVDPTPGFVLKL